VFNRQGRKPWSSVNFVTAHDGFTLNDLVSYNEKHNEANGENNQDGTSNNRSWNCGAEGPTGDPAINSLRQKRIRSFLATLLLAQGLPMMLAGDEFRRTQQGNNNAYCQDNELSWVDWSLAETHKPLIDFVRALTTLRNRYPVLRRKRFLTGADNEELGVKDVTWIHPSGAEMNDQTWGDPGLRCIGMLIDGRAQMTGIRERGSEATLLLIFNSHHEPVKFVLPAPVDGRKWQLQLDSDDPSQAGQFFAFAGEREAAARSVSVFLMQ
jgi:isoamylase